MKQTFTVKHKDNEGQEKEVVYAVLTPTPSQETKAKMHYVAEFNKALNSGAILRLALDRHMRQQGLWSDEQEAQFNALQKQISDGKRRLNMGGNAGLTKKQAFNLAMDMRRARQEFNAMAMSRNIMDNVTAEGIADEEKLRYLFSECFVYNDSGDKYFKNYDECKERSNEPAAIEGYIKFASLYYEIDKDYNKKLPENEFLLAHKFVDADLRLIDKDGNWVDENGKRVDKEGRYINEKGEYIDIHGNRVDLDGNYIVEFKPFLDDEPSVEPKEEVDSEATELVVSEK